MRHSWPRRTPMELISEGPPSYRGSASSCCSARRSACRHRRPRQSRSAIVGYREQLSVVGVVAVALGALVLAFGPNTRSAYAASAVGGTITRSEVIARAQYWVSQREQ